MLSKHRRPVGGPHRVLLEDVPYGTLDTLYASLDCRHEVSQTNLRAPDSLTGIDRACRFDLHHLLAKLSEETAIPSLLGLDISSKALKDHGTIGPFQEIGL